MSFVITARRFMSLALRDDGAAELPGFRPAPTARTSKAMHDLGLLFRPNAVGFVLYYTLNPAVTPALVRPIASRIRLSFALVWHRPEALEDLFQGLDGGEGAQVYLSNLDGGGAIRSAGPVTAGPMVGAADLVRAGPRAYPVRVDLSGGVPAGIEARELSGGAVLTETPILDLPAEPPVAPPPGATEIFKVVDLPAEGAAALRLVTAAPGTLDRQVYADDELPGSSRVIVDLHWETAQTVVPANTGVDYEAVFQRQ